MHPIELERRYSAPNYAPLPVVLARGQGAYLFNTDGRRYVDMMSAYSAASHGHAHPRILAALTEQAHRLAVPSRAYYNDRLGPFLAELCRLTGLDAAVPMNTGAEAVETAIKAARRWGYRVKGVPRDQATIIVANGNFHGRTTTIVGFSSESAYRDGFGPFTPGFRAVPLVTSPRSSAPSAPKPSRFWSNRFRARPASLFRRPVGCEACVKFATRIAYC